jgi:hypothetical protein
LSEETFHVVAPDGETPDEGLTTAEKWEIASIAFGIVFTVAYAVWIYSEMFEGKGGGPLYRLRWRLDQARRARADEAAFQKDKNRMLFEAMMVLCADT